MGIQQGSGVAGAVGKSEGRQLWQKRFDRMWAGESYSKDFYYGGEGRFLLEQRMSVSALVNGAEQTGASGSPCSRAMQPG